MSEKKVIIYSTDWCAFCKQAEKFLDSKKVPWEDFDIEKDEAANRAKHLDLFITEASFPDEQAALAESSRHLTPAKLGRELRKLKRNVPVAVYHLTPGERSVMLPQIEALGHPRLSLLAQDAVFEF